MASRYTAERDLSQAVKISWLGHAMFLLEDGVRRLVTDPYNDYVGYPLPDVTADIVLVSHDHADHSNIDLVKGEPVVVRDAAPREVAGVKVSGVSTHHDSKGGTERGPNIAFRWEMQGLTFVHLGDLGHRLDDEAARALAGTHILFVPVGGFFTLEPPDAASVVRALDPRIAIPMHYRNAACSFPIETEEPFAAHFDAVERTGRSPVYVSEDNLPPHSVVLIMDYLT
ncbi:MAG: MBL fold metallo-hydrolase [Actinomycetota bacterium]|nr:MBL fold metallo-hydrolase [Actinomycetota bacterium]MDD5668268.1 MBL fold metallo-hydrolase [Actinomycetota bacterium]